MVKFYCWILFFIGFAVVVIFTPKNLSTEQSAIVGGFALMLLAIMGGREV
jgi:hypothetical protein